MFDIGASELLLVVIVAVIVVGPKDLPLAMRTAGKWMAKVRRVSSHFRAGIDAMVREAEQEELEREWKDRNEAIMKAHHDSGEMHGPPETGAEAALESPTQNDAADEPQAPPPPP